MENTISLKRRRRLGVYLACSPYGGGSYQYAQFILEALIGISDRHDIIAFYIKADWEKFLKHQAFHEKYELKGSFTSRMRQIDESYCDIVIGTDQTNLSEYLHTPYLAIIHDLMHRYESAFPEVSADGEYERREWLYKGICDYSAGILVDSELGRKQVLESYGNQYADKIYIQPFRVPSYLMKVQRNSLLAENKYIFYPAQFWQHKNHQNLLLAVRQLADEGLRIKLVLVGSEKNASVSVQRMIHLLQLEEQVQCLGYVSDEEMCRLYACARAMVMPTFFGPTNIPPIEALWLGCPMGVSNIYAMHEQLQDAALYFDPKCVSSIAGVLRRLWTDDLLCQRLSEHERERSAYFSPQVFNRNFVENLNQIIRKIDNQYKAAKKLLDKCRDVEKIYLYGTGMYCSLVCTYLRGHNVKVNGILVTKAEENPSYFYGIPVLNCEDLPEKRSSALIVLSLDSKYYPEVKSHLEVLGIDNYQEVNMAMIIDMLNFSHTPHGIGQAQLNEFFRVNEVSI